jgi:hypothetical protein
MEPEDGGERDVETSRNQSRTRQSSFCIENPEEGQVTKGAVCELKDGLKVECEAVGFKFSVDVDKGLGGENSAPNPGACGRGAVAGCIAMGCAMRELPLDGIKVAVDADMDVGDLTPG